MATVTVVHFTNTNVTGQFSEACAEGVVQAGARTYVRKNPDRGPGI